MKFKYAVSLIVCLASISALGQAKTIDFTQALRGLDGKTIEIPSPSDPKKLDPLTLSDVCINALETPLDTDRAMTGEDKFKLDVLAHKIFHNKATSLTVEDIALLKDRVGKSYGALIVGDVWRLLDPAVK